MHLGDEFGAEQKTTRAYVGYTEEGESAWRIEEIRRSERNARVSFVALYGTSAFLPEVIKGKLEA